MSLGADLVATRHLPLDLPHATCEIGWGPCWDEARRRVPTGPGVVAEYIRIISDPTAPCQTPAVAAVFGELATTP